MSLGRSCASLASRVWPCRIAANASCSYARSVLCACTSPVVTVCTPRLRARRWRARLRCISRGRIGALQLDPQAVGPERIQQPPRGRLVFDAVARAPAQADQPARVLQDRVQ